jgi:small subunit ribosomal protein S12
LSTLYQLKKKVSLKRKPHSRTPALKNSPQVKGTVRRPRIVTPRKPNSARRPVAKVVLNNKKRVTAHLPGVGHNIRSHSAVLVRGGGARDLPGVRYTCVRGVYDFMGLENKKRRRSIYGAKRHKINKVRRKFRFR